MIREINKLLREGMDEVTLSKRGKDGEQYVLYISTVLANSVSSLNHVTHYDTVSQAVKAFLEATND